MKKGGFVLLLIGLAALWGIYEGKYYFSYFSDLQDRPWAYNQDEKAPLLIGKWAGNLKDPNGIVKSLKIEIFEPTTDAERQKNATRRKGRGSNRNKQAFDGTATVTSALGQEEYEIYGAVKKSDYHQLEFNFRPLDEAKRILPNFTLFAASNGLWQKNDLNLTLSFVYHNADGSSTSTSEGVVKNGKIEWLDSMEDKKATVTLQRISQ
jgi:hypothetical protein